MHKTTAFFDVDGLLLDTERLYFDTRRTVLAEHGIPFTREDNAAYIARGFADTRRRLRALAGDDALGDAIYTASMALYDARVAAGDVQLMLGVIDFLHFLRDRNIDCVITSSATRAIIAQNADAVGLTPYFDTIVSGDDVTHNKPAPDLYLHALAVTGATPRDVVVFEDAPSGITSALAAGLDVVAVPDQVAVPDELRPQVTAVVPNLMAATTLFD